MDVTPQEIVNYWTSHQSECDLSVDWAEAEKRCWRCSEKRKLQRCHIIPRTLGGGESPSNLILLCGQCHSEAPNVNDSEFMWTWLRAHAAPFYGTYWQERGVREYEFIFGEKPFEGLQYSKEMISHIEDAFTKLRKQTSTHWGQGKINPATWAWAIRQLDQKLRDNS